VQSHLAAFGGKKLRVKAIARYLGSIYPFVEKQRIAF
jgi:hypothetical protein